MNGFGQQRAPTSMLYFSFRFRAPAKYVCWVDPVQVPAQNPVSVLSGVCWDNQIVLKVEG